MKMPKWAKILIIVLSIVIFIAFAIAFAAIVFILLDTILGLGILGLNNLGNTLFPEWAGY